MADHSLLNMSSFQEPEQQHANRSLDKGGT